MNKLIKKIAAPLLVVSGAFVMAIGSAYALFTADDETNIAITAGKVDVVSSVDEDSIKLYSMGVQQFGTFELGGTATISDGNLVLDKIAPGDKIEFTLKNTNKSNVLSKVRSTLKITADDGLASGLVLTINGETKDIQFFATEWEEFDVGDEEEFNISIELPESAGNEYQEKTCTYNFSVEAVQGNAVVHNYPATVNNKVFNSFEEAVAEANSTNPSDVVKVWDDVDLSSYAADELHPINLTNNTVDLNGKELLVNNAGITMSGTTVIKNGSIKLADEGSYGVLFTSSSDTYEYSNIVFENLNIEGGLHLSNGNYTIKNCNVSGTKYYAIFAGAQARITVESGTFESESTEGGSLLCLSSTNTFLETKGGVFNVGTKDLNNGSGKIVTEGGTFNVDSLDSGKVGDFSVLSGTFVGADPTSYLVDGSTVATAGTTFTASENNTKAVIFGYASNQLNACYIVNKSDLNADGKLYKGTYDLTKGYERIIADGYAYGTTSHTIFASCKESEATCAVTIGTENHYYKDFAAAVQYAKDNSITTIKLYDNVTVNGNIDLTGITISNRNSTLKTLAINGNLVGGTISSYINLVANDISAGTFNCSSVVAQDISGGTFNKNVATTTARDVSGGTFAKAVSARNISGGIFNSTSANAIVASGAISGGTFSKAPVGAIETGKYLKYASSKFNIVDDISDCEAFATNTNGTKIYGAFSDIQSNGTVTLLANVTTTVGATLRVINLNGHTFTYNGSNVAVTSKDGQKVIILTSAMVDSDELIAGAFSLSINISDFISVKDGYTLLSGINYDIVVKSDDVRSGKLYKGTYQDSSLLFRKDNGIIEDGMTLENIRVGTSWDYVYVVGKDITATSNKLTGGTFLAEITSDLVATGYKVTETAGVWTVVADVD